MSISLRPYQQQMQTEMAQRLAAGIRRILFVAPTGSGKAVLMADVARMAAAQPCRCAALLHTRELLFHIGQLLADMGVPFGVIADGFKPDPTQSVQLCSVFTVVHRLELLADVRVALIDESHHVMATTWQTIINALPASVCLFGYTATPLRLDGKPLGDVFHAMVQAPSTEELIAAGWLVDARAFTQPEGVLDLSRARMQFGDFAHGEAVAAVERANVLGNVVAEYQRRAAGLSALAFTLTVAHAEQVARQFNAADIPADCLHGGLAKEVRDLLLTQFRRRELLALTSCEVLGEGLDVPGVGCIAMLRPTASLTVYLQQCGRAMRPDEGKTHFVLLDLVGNVIRHGLPSQKHLWSLQGPPPREPGEVPVWRCFACGGVNPLSATNCIACGAARPEPKREVRVNPRIKLVEVNAVDEDQLMRRRFRTMPLYVFKSRPRSLKEFQAFREAKGYKAGWVYYATQEHAARFGVWPS